jgi:hypothetical protein
VGNGGGSSPSTPTLSLSLQSTSLTTTPGTSFSVLVTASTNTSATPIISLGTLPAGLSCSNTFPLTIPASGASLNFITAPSIADGNYSIAVNGQADTATTQQNLSLTVTGMTGMSLTLGTATGYAGQGATMNVLTTVPPGYTGPMWLSFANLPSGITVPTQPLAVIPGAQQIGLEFAPSVAPANYSLTGTLRAGNQNVSGSNAVTVLAATGIIPNANNIDITPGGTAQVTLVCQDSAGTSCSLQGNINGLPAGLTVSPKPPWQVTSQGISLVFTAASSLPTGVYPVTITSINSSATLTLQFYVNNANFTLAVPQLTETALHQGSSTSLSFQTNLNVAFGGVANFTLNMSITGLPEGTSAAFVPSNVTPGNSTTLTISAEANAPIVYGQGLLVTATPTSTAVSAESVGFTLDVAGNTGHLPPSRSDLFNVDGSQLSGVFDPVHNVAFVSNPDYNRVDVISIASRSVLKSVPVPQPGSVTMSLDGTEVVVGTRTSQVVWIDTTALQVTKTYAVPAIPTNPPSNPPAAPYVHELAGGSLLIMPSFMIVNPSSGQVTTPTPPGFPLTGVFAVNDQGTKVVLVSNGNPQLEVYDVATGTFVSIAGGNAISTLGVDAAGTHVLAAGQSVDMYDISLNHLGSIDLAQAIVQPLGALFSPDGNTAYLDTHIVSAATPMIYTVDVPSLAWTGLASATGSTPFYVDPTGLVVGAQPFGVTLDDATFEIPAPVSPGYIGQVVPSVGPVGQVTQTQLGQNSGYALLPDVYFGSQLAVQESLEASAPGIATASAPASTVPGPVNLKFVWPDGVEAFLPLGFTYGPWIQKMLTTEAGPAGGASASLVALGVPADSSQVQLTVGGNPVSSVQYSPAGGGGINPYPFPATVLTFPVPPGTKGPANVSLTTPDGTTTLNAAFRYAQAVADYAAPTNGTVYHSLLLNPTRNEVYLSAGDHVDVFSISSLSFTGSLTPVSLSGKTLGGLAISPDGNTLYVADTTDGSLLVAALSNLGAGATPIPIAPSSVDNNCLYGPTVVAVTNNSKAYVTYDTTYSGSCFPADIPTTYLVDLQTSTVSTPFAGTNCGGYMATSADGSQLGLNAFGGFGFFCAYDVATSTIYTLDSGGAFNQGNGLAVSGDGTRMAFAQSTGGSWVVTTARGNVVNLAHAPAVFTLPDLALTSLKLTDSGSLLYVLYPHDIDIFDGDNGVLQERLALTETAQQELDSLAIDPSGQHAFILTDKGLSVVTFDEVPLSVSTLQPSSGSAGTLVVVRGSGFNSQTTATLNATSASVVFVDANTLNLTVPASTPGMQTLIVLNPDGQSDTLEGAFIEQ